MTKYNCWVLSGGCQWNVDRVMAKSPSEAADIYARMNSYTNHNVYVKEVVQEHCFKVVSKIVNDVSLVSVDGVEVPSLTKEE
jgi:hypothetical protein